MEEVLLFVPKKYHKTQPTPRAGIAPRHEPTVVCNGRVFRRQDFKSEKEWREAAAKECGFKNAVWNPPEVEFGVM